MLRKITRIFLKTLGTLLLILFLLGVGLYFGIQSYTFQTWLGHKASNWLSKELKSEIRIDKINLDFFSKANLENVLILDKHKDTLLYANLLVNIKDFDYKHRSFILEKIILKNAVSKVVKYKGDKEFNYGFIEDYFSSGTKDTSQTTSQAWDIKFGDVVLNNVAFTYRNEKYDQTVSQNMNYDNIVVSQIFGTISKFRLNGDTILADIKDLRAKEQCGIELKNLVTNVTLSEKQLLCENMHLTTANSFVRGKLNFLYNQWEDYYDFIDKVKINSILEDSTSVNLKDIAFFAEELNGLNKTVLLTGKVKGLVKDLSLQNFKLAHGAHTRFAGNMNMRGLPDVENLYLYFDAKKLSTSFVDITHTPNYPFYENKNLNLPEEFRRLGIVSYVGKFDGYVKDFSVDGIFNTDLGSAVTKVSVKIGDSLDNFSYKGRVETQSFDLGTLLRQRDFNGLSLNCEIEGKGTNVATMEANLKGEISNVNIYHYNYRNITINGEIKNKLFEGSLKSKDPNADFTFNGTVDFHNKIPDMHFISIIHRLKLNELHFTNSADSGVISSKVFVNVSGDNIDNLSGFAVLDSTVYKTKTRTFALKDFYIKAEQNTPDKQITLKSAYLNASMNGKFLLSNLRPALQNFLFAYYPTFFKKNFEEQYSDEFDFNVKIKRFNTIHDLFLPDVMISPNTEIKGGFNASEKKLYAQAISDKLSYKNFTIHQLMLFVNEQDSIVTAEVFGKALNLSDSLALDDFKFKLNSVDDNLKYVFDWDNYISPRNKGKILGGLIFENEDLTISCDTLNVLAHDSLWTLISPSSLLIKKDGSVSVNTFSLHCNQQAVDIAGTLSDQANDKLIINTHSLILQEFNPLIKEYDLTLEGLMNSELKLSNENKNFVFEGDLHLSKLRLNDNTIGFLKAKTRYNDIEKKVEISGYTSLNVQKNEDNSIKDISFNGNYYTQKTEESIDIDFNAQQANLRMLNPFLKDILTINNAFVNGKGKIHGTPNKIKLDGAFRLVSSEIKVDYTNVTYNVVGDIELMPDQIRFSDLLVREKGSKAAPTGTVNGNMFHDNFSKIQIDYDVNYKNMLALNTTAKENKLYYGKVYATGNMGIYGFINDLHMEINATTNKNSRFVLPLDGTAEIDEGGGDFIYFVKKDTATTSEEKQENAMSGFDLKMRLSATSDATTQIVMDQRTGDILNLQGVGNLDLRINTFGKFEMFGDYFITNGDYVFTLENLINKKFEIDAGSSISWSGDPVNADINVTASYRQRVSIAPLLNDSVTKSRTPVDCKLLISDKLFSPMIKFAIDFPTLDATRKSLIDNILSDEAELNRQVFSFLLFRMFVTPQIYNSSGGGVASFAGNGAASTGSEILSNRLTEFMNTYFGNLMGLKNLQMGVNYRAATQTNNQAVDLNLNQQFFNNKLSVDGNIGVNNTTKTNNSSNNNLIGDVTVEYKLSDDGRYRLKAFNRGNDTQRATMNGGPITQGVGFFYREEFETFEKLLKGYKDRVRRRKDAKQNIQ